MQYALLLTKIGNMVTHRAFGIYIIVVMCFLATSNIGRDRKTVTFLDDYVQEVCF